MHEFKCFKSYIPNSLHDPSRHLSSCYDIKESGQQESGSTFDVHVADACNKEADQATLRKLEANVRNGADYDVWLPLASVHEVNDRMNNYLYGYFIGGVDSVLRNVWVKFHDVPLVAYTLDGLSLMAMKIGTPIMLDSKCYTKETIRIEYEWESPRCSTCLIFGHSPVDFPKALKFALIRVVNQKDKGKGLSSVADDEGFIKVKKKKSGGNNGGTKNFTFSVKPKPQYRPREKQSTVGASNSPKTTPFVGTNKASTSGYNKESSSNKGNTFFLSNSFEALNDENLIIEEVATGSMATTSGKLVLIDDEGKPLKKVDYPVNLGSDDEVKPVKNEMTSFLASKSMGVGYGLKSLLEQLRESNVDNDYGPYDDDMYKGQEIPNSIQTICDNLDIKVRGRKKK
ncbi:hypothetical protein Tco_1468218 [Tanacetum coccineum]